MGTKENIYIFFIYPTYLSHEKYFLYDVRLTTDILIMLRMAIRASKAFRQWFGT